MSPIYRVIGDISQLNYFLNQFNRLQPKTNPKPQNPKTPKPHLLKDEISFLNKRKQIAMTSPAVGTFYEFKDPETQAKTIGKTLSIDGDVVTYLVF